MCLLVLRVWGVAVGRVAVLLFSFLAVSEQVGPVLRTGTTTPTVPRSTTTEIDHFDRDHPVNVTMYSSTVHTINTTWRLPNHENQTELENFVFRYYKTKYAKDESHHKEVWVAADVTSYLLEHLKAGTRYSFNVVANYSLGHQPHSITYTMTTHGYGEDRPCGCTPAGTLRGKVSQCDSITGQCECNDKYTLGRRCDNCTHGYMWHNLTGCQICTCDKTRGTGTCSVDSDGIVKCNCHKNYGGHQCLYCAHKYYLVDKWCLPCHCNNNTNSNYRACDLESGVCLNCMFNTTGDHCEKCKDGYVGDPIISRNCTSIDEVRDVLVSDSPTLGGVLEHHLGSIIGVCIAVLGLVLMVVGVIVYRHWWRWRRRPLQFWTVQLKEDRERVSFSAEHPTYQHVDGGAPPDDVHFYDQPSNGWHDEALGRGRGSTTPNGSGGRSRPRTHAGGDGSNPYRCLEEA